MHGIMWKTTNVSEFLIEQELDNVNFYPTPCTFAHGETSPQSGGRHPTPATHRRNLLTSFRFAFSGLTFAFKTQRNLRIHIFIGIAVLLAGFLIRVSSLEAVILCLTIILVIVSEIINTALELSLDFVNGKSFHPLVKVIKDVTAAVVLLTSLNAVIVGTIIFMKNIRVEGIGCRV